MALKILQSGIPPLGQFDGYDAILTSIKGGEVGTIAAVAVGTSDKATADANGSDGYVGNPATRPYITSNLAAGSRPLFLLDEGIAGYGTLFGSVVGGTAGQVVTGGAVLGPHTATASGKITCWDKPGTYAVTLDAVDTASTDGLVPTNSTLAIGDKLYATSAGLLTPTSSKSFEGGTPPVLGRFIEFTTDRSLVTTPPQLTSTFSSPQQLQFTQAVIYWQPPIA